MLRLWRFLGAIGFLLLQLCSAALSSTCTLPDFSYRNGAALAWLSSRSKHSVGAVRWLNLPKKFFQAVPNEMNASCDNYLDWLHNDNSRKFYCDHTYESAANTGTLQTGGKYAMNSFATQELKEGDTIFKLPMTKCLSSRSAASSLAGAPWEIQLASVLLTEWSRGASSRWASFIQVLPSYLPMPIFFTNMELENIEEAFLSEEIYGIRNFVLGSFQVLYPEEIAHSKLSAFAWAMSVVYSSACKLKDGESALHILPPVLGTGISHHDGKNAFFASSGGLLRLVCAQSMKSGESLSYYRAPYTRTDAFLFQGSLPKHFVHDKQRLFKDIPELSGWFFSQYGGVNGNRQLTLTVANDGFQALKQMKPGSGSLQRPELSVDSSGYISPALICIFAALSYARASIEQHNDGNEIGEAPLDFDNKNGTYWEKQLDAIGRRSLSYHHQFVKEGEGETGSVDQALWNATKTIKERLAALLSSYTTDSLEDNLLLEAARFEKTDAAAFEDLCSSCRFQIEKQSLQDTLVAAFQASRKQVFRDFLKLHSMEKVFVQGSESFSNVGSAASTRQFSTWMKEHGFAISDKLAISMIDDASSNRGSVRGVVVLKDIEEGETLCMLPLSAGLFDNSSESQVLGDSWDLAAARLLQEKALGNSSAWAEYIAILPHDVASPVYLDSTELQEVQWKPTMRELVQLRRAIRKSFLDLKPAQVAFADYKEYEWAAVMVHSRAFTLPVLPNEKYSHYVLMPYMDMINHHYVYQADWISQPVVDGKLEIIAKRPLRKGEQLFASFGPRSNDNLFLYYGFLLKDNPFDSAQIFASFKDAVTWLVETWSGPCTHCSEFNISCSSACKRNISQSVWPSVKTAIEDFEGGSVGQGKDWWDLISRWADYGYQYLPYQPGPTIYSYGITDPSLIAAFDAAFPTLHGFEKNNSSSGNSTAYLRGFFSCIESLGKPTHKPLFSSEHACSNHLVPALQSSRQMVAKLSVALRCAELLAGFPTSISQDEVLLRQGIKNRHVQLAVDYRYRKKLLLKGVIDRLLNSS